MVNELPAQKENVNERSKETQRESNSIEGVIKGIKKRKREPPHRKLMTQKQELKKKKRGVKLR